MDHHRCLAGWLQALNLRNGTQVIPGRTIMFE